MGNLCILKYKLKGSGEALCPQNEQDFRDNYDVNSSSLKNMSYCCGCDETQTNDLPNCIT